MLNAMCVSVSVDNIYTQRKFSTADCSGAFNSTVTPTPTCDEQSSTGSFGRFCVSAPTAAPSAIPSAVPTVAPTTQGLGNIGFVTFKYFPSNAHCFGTVSEASIVGTGVCFYTGDVSEAFVLAYNANGELAGYKYVYSDNACTVLESTEEYFTSSKCVTEGSSSYIYSVSTAAPDLSTFGNGIFTG